MSSKIVKKFMPEIIRHVGNMGYDTSKGVLVTAESRIHLTVHYDGKNIGMGQLSPSGMMLIIKPKEPTHGLHSPTLR
jgi:hypothetical protein